MDTQRILDNFLKARAEAASANDQPSELLLLLTELLREEIAEQVRKIVREEFLPELSRLKVEEKADALPHIEELRQVIRNEIQAELAFHFATPELPPVDQNLPDERNLHQGASSEPAQLEDTIPESEDTTLPEESIVPTPVNELHQDIPLPIETEPASIADEPRKLKPLSEVNLRLGIDFGTSTTAISVSLNDEHLAVPIGSDGIARYIPSVVYINPGDHELNERVFVGEEAERMPDETKKIRSVKRCLDCNGQACSVSGKPGGDEKFPWCSGTGTTLIGENKNVLPKEIAYLIIREALLRAVQWLRENQGIDITLENITTVPLNLGCGARFSYHQRKILIDIVSDLGFKNIGFNNVVEEPILAGFSFSRLATDANGYSLIYDFGGGTLDVAVVDVVQVDGKQQITVLATAAENWLGGDDIDQLVYGEFLRQAALQENQPIEQLEKEFSPVDKAKLRLVAKQAKESLSETDLFDSSFLSEVKGYLDVRLTVQEFESLLEQSGLIKKSLDTVRGALRLTLALKQASNSDLFDVSVFRTELPEAADCIQHVVLVGGITKIPFVRKKLIEIFGRGKIVEQTVVEPVSAVAIGASYPKDATHFSISAPPFGIILQYSNEKSSTSKVEKHPLCWPFAEYSYYHLIHAVSIAQHQVPFPIKDDCYNASIMIKNVLDDSTVELINIGKLAAGEYDLFIDLDGSVSYQPKGGKPSKKIPLPLRHPAQELIEQNKIKRHKENNKKTDTDRDDDIRSMMYEN
jgi:molecular chaperone DnaK (HSP70)